MEKKVKSLFEELFKHPNGTTDWTAVALVGGGIVAVLFVIFAPSG